MTKQPHFQTQYKSKKIVMINYNPYKTLKANPKTISLEQKSKKQKNLRLFNKTLYLFNQFSIHQ